MSETQQTEKKSISERLAELLPQLSKDQLRFVTAMQESGSKKEAAEAIGLQPNTVYKWPEVVDEVAHLIALDIAGAAREIRKRNLVKAVMVKVAGLDSDDERIRQAAATEIIEGELGKPTQKQEVTGANGETLKIRLTWGDEVAAGNGDNTPSAASRPAGSAE